MIRSGFYISQVSRRWINSARFRGMQIKEQKFSLEAAGGVERDPDRIKAIEVVDFDSSFSEESQVSVSTSFPNYSNTHKLDNRINYVGKLGFQNEKTDHGNRSFSNMIPVDSSSEFSDSFDFSDDDDAVLIAAANHKANSIRASPSGSSKRPALSPFKNETKRAVKDSTNMLGFYSIDFEKTKESKVEMHPKKSKELQSVSKVEKKISSELNDDIKVTIDRTIHSPFVMPNNAPIIHKPDALNLSHRRNISTTTKIKASEKKKEEMYHSIQFATQKPDLNQEEFIPSASNVKSVKPIILSSEQECVLKQVLGGASLFYTGSAGTGKSVLLKTIIKSLKGRFKEGGVAVTASTGLAACNIGGITLHSFAGVGLAKEPTDQLIKKLRRNRKAINKWLTTKVLIIDEISMVDGELLNKLNDIAKRIRKNQLPFGGIQLVTCGDFYQLPPVAKRTASDGSELNSPQDPLFSFESYAWRECIKQTIILKEVFRQKGDQVFIDMLNEMRTGLVSEQSIREFHQLSRPLQCPAGIVPTELFATRMEVDRANNSRLHKIHGPAQVFNAIDSGSLPNPQRQTLLSNFLAPAQLFLKKDAQVMCIKNFDDTLVNGSLGQVIGFMDKDTYTKAYGDEKENGSDYIFSQDSSSGENHTQNEPLSISSDSTEVTSKAGLPISISATSELSQADPEEENKRRKQQLLKTLKEESKNKKYPLVRFLLPDGVNTRTVLVEPEQWNVEDEAQQILVSRVQLPLILAWSISIHKSQGQTLPKVKVDLKNVFETGQSYVALSRAVSREGLQVLNFNENKVRSHAKVVQFYKTLLSAEESSKTLKGQQTLNFASKKGSSWEI